MYKVKDNLFFDMHLAQANYSANEIKGAAFWFSALVRKCQMEKTNIGIFLRIWFIRPDTKSFGCYENGDYSKEIIRNSESFRATILSIGKVTDSSLNWERFTQ